MAHFETVAEQNISLFALFMGKYQLCIIHLIDFLDFWSDKSMRRERI